MSQRAIDRLLLFSSALIIVIFAVESLFMNQQLVFSLHYEYMQEMLRRAAYSSSMFSWVGSAEYINHNIMAGQSYLADSIFDLTVTSEKRTSTLSAEGSFPYTAICYDGRMKGSIVLVESFQTPPQLGCTAETLTAAAGFGVMAVMAHVTLIKVANLCAQRFPQRTVVIKSILVLGFTTPLFLAVAMQFFLTASQIVCMQNTWLDDAKRTVNYIAAVFEMVTLGLGADGAILFGPTMKLMNDNLITDGRFGFSSIPLGSPELVPDIPRTPDAVKDVLFSHDGELADYKHYFTKEYTFLTTYFVSSLNILVVLVHMVDNSMLQYGDPQIMAGMWMLVVPLGLLAMFHLIVFPYKALGKVCPTTLESSSQHENLGAGTWRVSPRWTLWKVLHIAALIAMMVGFCYVYVERVSQYFAIMASYSSKFRSKVESVSVLQKIGDLQLENMVSLVLSAAWMPTYISVLPIEDESFTMEVAIYYEQLAGALRTMRYQGMSNSIALSTETASQYPVILNAELGTDLSAAVESPSYPSSLKYYSYAYHYDSLIVRDIITNDYEALLAGGDAEALALLLDNVADIGSTKEVVELSVQSVVVAAAPYITIAQGYQSAFKLDTNPVTTLMNSTVGRIVGDLENKAIDDLNPDSLAAYSTSFAYTRMTYSCTYIAIIAILMAAGALIFDIFYTGAFFGLSDGSKSAQRKMRYLPSNDYTSPSPFLEVNHHTLWRAARVAYGVVAFTGIAAAVVLWISMLEAKRGTTALINEQYANAIITKGSANTLYQTSLVSVSSACWLRSLLSLNATDILKGVGYMKLWASSVVTTYNGGAPESDASETDTALRKALRDVSVLVELSVIEPTMQRNVYRDYVALHGMLETYYPFKTISDCLSPVLLLVVTMALFQLMVAIVEQDEVNALVALIQIQSIQQQSEATACGLSSDFILYLNRLYAFSLRANQFLPTHEVAEKLDANTAVSTADVDSSIRTVLWEYFEDEHVMEDYDVPWIVMLSAWSMSLLIGLFYVQMKNMYESLYNG